jgi:poly(A) polymerase
MSVPQSESARAAFAELLKPTSPVLEVAERFRTADQELYLVGGTVRDAFLGRPHEDLDFATNAPPELTLELVGPLSEATWLQGMKFGTVGAKISGLRVEITTFRTERYAPESRHPEVEFAPTIDSDLSRRDFTVNAMALRLPEKEAVDPFGGLEDLDARVLRTPMEPASSFTDDPLRMLRAFRFASQLDFKIHEEVLASVAELRNALTTVSAERIRDEFSRLITGDSPGRALKLADKTGITELFLPELSALKLEQDPVHRHKDVFLHTLAVVERTRRDDEVLRLSALLHDIGKPKTRKIEPGGVTFHHHEVVGAEMAQKRLKALRYPNETVFAVTELIRLHHRFHTYRLGWSDSAVRRYVRDAGPLLGRLNDLVRADCTTQNPAKARELGLRMDELEGRIRRLAQQEELARIRPELDGVQVMAYLGEAPGPLVGEALRYLLEVRLDEGILGEDAVYSRLDDWARERGLKPEGARVPPREEKTQ